MVKINRMNLQRFATGTTMMEDMFDPEVLASMISAQLPKAIKFSGIAPIDTTLEGRPGTTITIPKWEYIGDAKDVAEGEAIDFTKMAQNDQQFTIKKAGKGIELTDEAVLSGYGDPQGEAQAQIRMSIASKVDNDIVGAAKGTSLVVNHKLNVSVIDQVENTFVDAPDAIEAEDAGTLGVIFMSYKDASALREAAANSWTRASELGDNILVSGAFGELLGWEIVRTKKLNQGEAIAVKVGALKTFLKRNIMVEMDRDIRRKLTEITADEHYVVALVDETKCIKIQSLPLSVDKDIAAGTDLFGKTVSDLQTNITIDSGDVLHGTVKYIADYSAAGYTGDEKSGNFLVLHAACAGASSIKGHLEGGPHAEATLDSDGLMIFRISDKDKQKVRFTATDANGVVCTRMFDLSNLELEEA